MQEGAFGNPTNCIVVRLAEFDSSFNVVASRGAITVADVFQSIFTWVNQRCSRDFCNRFSPSVFDMASQYLSARGGAVRDGDGLRISDFLGSRLRFMGLTRAMDGCGYWDLHLAALS
jgi:hypothetical protein